MLSRFIVYLFMMIVSAFAWAEGDIIDMRVATNTATTTRVVFDVKGDLNYRYFKLANPDRFVVDFYGTKAKHGLTKLDLENVCVTNVRTGHPNDNTLRLVFEVNDQVETKRLVLPKENHTTRLVFDLTPKHPPKKPTSKLKTKPLGAIGRNVMVIIDAGHGGKDPGAHGKGGTEEKTVVLAIARELQKLINQTPGMQAVMTRDSNHYVPLRNRLSKARKGKGDVFISIHADAFKNAQAAGASVFALSMKGASSEAARWLAAKENHSELGQVKLDDKDDVLRSVLIDLSQTATISSSLDLGGLVLKNLKPITKLHHAKVEQARFVVLKSPDIPSILVETGFISNPEEEKRLRSPRYQKQLAQAIVKGVQSYFRYRAPPGTWLASHYGQYHELNPTA